MFRARAQWLYDWWFAIRTVSCTNLLVTYFQLMSGIERAFPLSAKRNEGGKGGEANGTRSTFSASNATSTSNSATALEALKITVQPVLDFVSNVNVQALEAVRCLSGPRHFDKLVAGAVVILGPIILAWFIVGTFESDCVVTVVVDYPNTYSNSSTN